MNRRAFVTGLGAVFAAPRAVGAQQARNVPRIGWLSPGSPATTGHFRTAFIERLHDLGWIEGQNILVETRWADGVVEKLQSLAAELVTLKVDVIVAAGASPVIRAAKHATSMIPIVMAVGVDPVGQGFISSLGRPGGNITGVAWDPDPIIYSKYLEFLKQIIPGLRRVGGMREAGEAYVYRKALEDAAFKLGLTVYHAEVRASDQFEDAFSIITRERAQALIVYGSALTFVYRRQIVELAARHKLADIYVAKEWVEAGGLMSYGVSLADLYRRAAGYVDRILKGAKPADLPVEQAMKFEFVINLKTAKALGLTIPPSLLLRADQVIE